MVLEPPCTQWQRLHYLWIFFGQVCWYLGENSSHLPKCACSYTYGCILVYLACTKAADASSQSIQCYPQTPGKLWARQTAGVTNYTRYWASVLALSHAALDDSRRLKLEFTSAAAWRRKGRRECRRCVPRDCALWTRVWRGG